MRFKDVTLPYNPARLTIKEKRLVARHPAPFAGEVVQDMGAYATEISGEGELFGADVFGQYSRLCALVRHGGAGLLYLPGQEPFYAHFAALTLYAQPGSESLAYTFAFIQDAGVSAATQSVSITHTVRGGETLFDIAARYGMQPGELLALNPQVASPNRLTAGTVLHVRTS